MSIPEGVRGVAGVTPPLYSTGAIGVRGPEGRVISPNRECWDRGLSEAYCLKWGVPDNGVTGDKNEGLLLLIGVEGEVWSPNKRGVVMYIIV